MRRLLLAVGFVALLGLGSFAAAQYPPPPPRRPLERVPVYRLYNWQNQDHLLTTDLQEAEEVPVQGYHLEGVAFYLANRRAPGLAPLYRFLNVSNGNHVYDTSPTAHGQPNVVREGVLGYLSVRRRPGLPALYDWYNPETDVHFYTDNPGGELAPESGYRELGLVGYVFPSQ